MHKYNYALLNKDYICINALSTDSADAALQKVNVDDMIVEISSDLFDISLVGKKFDSSTQMFSNVPLPPKTLDETKADKRTEITQLYQAATQTFQSSALGSSHTYLADDTSMGKFNAEYTFINSASYDNSNINWYTVEQGGVVHTKDQFNQVWLDGRSYLTSMFNKWDTLMKQINACTDIASVQAITW
jgi:hypothetical protein